MSRTKTAYFIIFYLFLGIEQVKKMLLDIILLEL